VKASDAVAGSGGRAGDGLGAVATPLLLLAAAIARWFAFMPPELPIATVAWLAIFAVAALRARSASVLLASAFLVDLLWWLLVQRWVVEVSVVGYPVLCLYLASWSVALAWLLRRLSHREATAGVPLWIALPVVVVALDFLRGEVVLGGYPWYEAGQGIAGTGGLGNLVAQSADLLGARGLSILAAVLAGAIATFALPRRPGRDRRGAAVAAASLAIATGLYGGWRLGRSEAAGPPARLLAIQTALPIDNKIGWSAERQLEDVPAFARATLEAVEAAESPVDLVVWPETMLPGFGLEPDTLRTLERGGFFPGSLFAEIAHEVAVRSGAPLLVGSPSHLGLGEREGRWTWDAHFNSVYLVPPRPFVADGDAPPRYDKMVLTPFGETMPGISRFEALEQALLDIGARGMSFDLDAGTVPVRFEVAGSGDAPIRIATPICFEATVASLCRRLVWSGGERVADLLVNVSNDGWLGDDLAARAMHLRLAALRAIENRTPMLRAVNTGFSAGIDSSGRIVAGLDGSPSRLGTEAGWVRADLSPDPRRPLFAIVGDRWALLTVGLVGVGLWLGRRRNADSIRDRR